ncbi:hypothetical protein BJB45_02320 [Halomonas huangheensis]|uniref:Uncharacterized protein n=1 Tax=Halomonas huangheensis TaxID=1178482 RepID=W1N482_9GAMM|nr:hypothetical protein AR456_03820 [Halomonas huangheensis]ERL49981.1 hypothetical protein BJB45_02320 [Halomonas huangheensis]
MIIGQHDKGMSTCLLSDGATQQPGSGRRSLSAVYDPADGLKFITGKMFEFSRQEVADLLHRDASAAGNLTTTEIGYGDQPCNYAH